MKKIIVFLAGVICTLGLMGCEKPEHGFVVPVPTPDEKPEQPGETPETPEEGEDETLPGDYTSYYEFVIKAKFQTPYYAQFGTMG